MQRAVITVRGRVQKVGYRDMAAEMANKMDITGIVKNLPDGKSVKIIAEAEKDVLDEFIKLLRAKDDPIIKVKNMDAAFEPATGEYEFFDIVYEDFEKEGFERIGEAVMYLKRLDAGQNKMLEKQDVMIEKLDDTRKEIVGEIREMRGDLRSYLDNRFMGIEYDIAEIKAKIGLR
jgi:acylphosphatase